MPEKPILEEEEAEQLSFWRGWRGLYVFVLVYGAIQVLLLYLFTKVFNRP